MTHKLKISLFLLIASTQLVGMQQHTTRRQLTAKEVITGTLIAGLTIEATYLIMQEERYKHVGKFMIDHPGLSIAAGGALLGTTMIYREPVRNLILTLADLVK